MADELKELTNLVGSLTAKVEKLSTTPAVDPKSVIGTETNHAPAVRKGASVLSSQPFRLTRLLGSLIGAVSKEEAKNEIALTKSFRDSLEESDGIHQDVGTGALMPVAKSFLGDKARSHKGIQDYFAALNGQSEEVDLDEVKWMAKSFGPAVRKTAMSYLDESIGGSLVAPAEQGEIIPLMRNKSAVSAAGARQVALPPQGKWVAPRITGPSTGYWITENTAITESNPTTGMVSMMAKKLGVLIRVPNELFKFATATNDAMLKDDIAKTLALGFDYACLYGAGAGQPKGLKNYTGTNELFDYAAIAASAGAPKGVATDGNTLRPEDGYRMKSRIAQRNFDTKGWKWIGTPILQGSIVSFRADAVSAGDKAGQFAQDLTRALGFNAGTNWCGSEFVESAQVRSDYTKGSGTALTELFGGVWSEILQGIYGAMEFATASQGDTAFAADQSLIRGILFCDSVPRYPGAFIYYKELLSV